MSDEPVPEVQPGSEDSETPPSGNSKTAKRTYSISERYIALAAVDLNGGNVYRTAAALDIPYATLYDWVQDRISGKLDGVALQGVKERRGDMASKLESLIHSAIESAPAKLAKATFSQTMVGVGIGIDKLRLLRGQGLEPDPATELCKLLGINVTQLPDRLELGPGDELPSGFGFSGPVIEAELEPSQPLPLREPTYHPHAQNCPFPSNPSNPELCSCGAYDLNQAEEIAFARLSKARNSTELNALPGNNAANLTEDGSPTPPEEATDGDAELLNAIDDDDSAN